MDTFENQNNAQVTAAAPAVATQAAALAVQANTPMAMIAAAVAKGVDTEQLSKLMDLQERWEKNEARKAFADAMVAFKSEEIKIEKNKDVHHNGKFMYSHATLDNVCRQIIKALQAHGISHSWRVEQVEGKVKVSCVLRHKMGHEETVTLEGAPDTSGAMNAIQALASTVSYLERYTLLASTGLASGVDDDDGATAFGLTDQQKAAFEKGIKEATSAKGLADFWKTIVQACNDTKDTDAYNDFKGKVAVRGGELKVAA